MNNGIKIENCTIQQVFHQKITGSTLCWDILRLDRIHSQISGNKYFKLKYALAEAKNNEKKGLLTFGGAWSNHILATACAANMEGLSSIGLIRGEKPAVLSPTLTDAKAYGMDIRFISRKEYSLLSRGEPAEMEKLFPQMLIIPEGGYSIAGARGAAEIHDIIDTKAYDWIICACGTGTTIAGLIMGAKKKQAFLGISVLKNHFSLKNEILELLPGGKTALQLETALDFHFGGYAKYTPELLRFMNEFYELNTIPTDFVYTGKLMYAVNQLIHSGYFPHGSKILTIHSGGLQGNRSLKTGILSF